MTRPVQALVCLVALAAAYGAGRFTAPTKIETRTEYLHSVREVRTAFIHRDVVTKIRRVVVTTPDGSSTSTEEIDSRETTNTAENAKVDSVAKAGTESKKTFDAPRVTILVTGGLDVSRDNFSTATRLIWGVTVGYRVAGPLVVAVSGQSNGVVSAGVGITF